MSDKKNFTKADGAIDKLFIPYQAQPNFIFNEPDISQSFNITDHTKHTNILYDTNVTNDSYGLTDADIIKPKNKSKHYDKRGKRNERLGLLLDGALKRDLVCLSKISGNGSLNDLVVTVLVNYVEEKENQERIKQYHELLCNQDML